MSEPFRTRTGVCLAPQDRPRKQRRAARVVVVSPAGRVLLFADTDPGLPGSQWWVTPGGGLDPGETPREAARRELREETGLVVDDADLEGPLAHRVVIHGYSDQVLVQEEWFYRVRLDEFEVDTSGFTELEKLTLLGHGWFALDDLGKREVWPAQLAELVTADDSSCLEWGEVDESTVPVDATWASRISPAHPDSRNR
ncbi:NUDIX hydrolase [Aestuariimicrobium ganziense]|uniref:NUDIX hydrolase n=1 Tax=Aestuariimicrobium ganziense TaxID=2773677 RepID=UPI00194101F0|nr:NUDIX domain-containing protein [Aestuariimicrobium ganziense]